MPAPSKRDGSIAVLYLTSAVARPTMGRLADLFGPRRIYLIPSSLSWRQVFWADLHRRDYSYSLLIERKDHASHKARYHRRLGRD